MFSLASHQCGHIVFSVLSSEQWQKDILYANGAVAYSPCWCQCLKIGGGGVDTDLFLTMQWLQPKDSGENMVVRLAFWSSLMKHRVLWESPRKPGLTDCATDDAVLWVRMQPELNTQYKGTAELRRSILLRCKQAPKCHGTLSCNSTAAFFPWPERWDKPRMVV